MLVFLRVMMCSLMLFFGVEWNINVVNGDDMWLLFVVVKMNLLVGFKLNRKEDYFYGMWGVSNWSWVGVLEEECFW